jgi:hypothetical protein
MRALLIFLAFVAAAVAQSSIDPYQFIDKKTLNNADVNQLWRTLGISGKIRETMANGSKDTTATFKCADDCEAQRVGLSWPLLDGDGEDAVIRISPAYLNANLSRFLVFHRSGDRPWQLIDYLDSTEWDYNFPSVSVANSAGKRWLVVTLHPHCGTGCSLTHADWYELNNGKLRMVLTVPLDGGQFNENPARQFETRFLRGSQSGGRETLEFIYHVEFRPSFRSSIDTDLWGEEKVIRFSRATGQSEFRFDPRNSEASETFVEDIFSSHELGPPRLFKSVQDRLLAIARGPNGPRRRWLKEVLDQNPNLPELASVRAAFAKLPASAGRSPRGHAEIPDRK